MSALARHLVGSAYQTSSNESGYVSLGLSEVALEDVAVTDGVLVGPSVVVSNRAVIYELDRCGGLMGRPLDPLCAVQGALCFDPSEGGVRTRVNRLARGAHNRAIAEATRFGMVNAYHHANHAARYVNNLLAQLGAPPLPPLYVVVNAHSGSKVPGFAHGDGDYRQGRLHPLSGGHYRLSVVTTGVPEPLPVRPTGEVHLGPGRHCAPFAERQSYLRNAAHNPATIYHEFGHHLCRHSADFRLNGERAHKAQRNGKTAPEEGVCDYLAATLLGTGRPYGWYRPRRGEQRDPESTPSEQAFATDAIHGEGARWARALWRSRRRLLDDGVLSGAAEHDRIVVGCLLDVGNVARRGRDRLRRRLRESERAAPLTFSSAYLRALADVAGDDAAAAAAGILDACGVRVPGTRAHVAC